MDGAKCPGIGGKCPGIGGKCPGPGIIEESSTNWRGPNRTNSNYLGWDSWNAGEMGLTADCPTGHKFQRVMKESQRIMGTSSDKNKKWLLMGIWDV